MLATICEWIKWIVSIFVNILAAGYIVGRLIANTLSFISDTVVDLAKIIADFALTFYEDAKIFVLDLDYQYGHIIKMLNNGINNSIGDVYRMALTLSSSVSLLSNQTKIGIQKMFTGFFDLFSYTAVSIRDWFVLIGNSVWMLLMCIPNLTIFLVQHAIKFTLFIWKSIVDTIKLSANVATDSISKTVTFFTSLPLQSVCGLISIYFIIKYRKHVLWMLKSVVYRAIATIISYIVRNVIVGLVAVLEFLALIFYPIRSFLPNIWRLSPIQEDYANPSTSSGKVDAFNFCVICQSEMKSIVLLPCRHLCLCQDCFKQLRRYRRECPMCREPYEHSIQVYA